MGGTSSGTRDRDPTRLPLSCSLSMLTPGEESARALPAMFLRLLVLYPKNAFKKKIQPMRLRKGREGEPLVLMS